MLNQKRPAGRLLHPQLALLHPAGQRDFPLPRQQRDGAHLAEIHPDRIVRVDRFLRRLRGGKLVFLDVLGMKEIGFLIEWQTERLGRIRQELIFKVIHWLQTSRSGRTAAAPRPLPGPNPNANCSQKSLRLPAAYSARFHARAPRHPSPDSPAQS